MTERDPDITEDTRALWDHLIGDLDNWKPTGIGPLLDGIQGAADAGTSVRIISSPEVEI